jgi:PHD-finger/PLU-1-like protein
VHLTATDTVQRIRALAQRTSSWRERVKAQIHSTEHKMTMTEAKALVEEGDKLKLACHELKVLRNAIRSTKVWMGQVKKCKVELGATAAADLESLIDDHDGLLIAMPEEVDKLKQATKGFCLCRRPYEGFMIGCDSCDEWYHGSCIGVSASQADRYEKYVCVRCCVQRVFDGSASNIANIIRKWTSKKDCKKARQAEYQKHQRRVRKEKKDIEKFEMKLAELRLQLEPLEHPCEHNIGAIRSKPDVQRNVPALFELSVTLSCNSVDAKIIGHSIDNQNAAKNVNCDRPDQSALEVAEVEIATKLPTEPTVICDSVFVPNATRLSEQLPGKDGGDMKDAGSSSNDVSDMIQSSKKLITGDALDGNEAEAPTQSREGEFFGAYIMRLLHYYFE